jgi:hypothetical protein
LNTPAAATRPIAFAYPLARMRVAARLPRQPARSREHPADKVVEVCAQVASGRAHEVAGRSVHELTAGETGKAIVRATDGAKAWRCSLQAGSRRRGASTGGASQVRAASRSNSPASRCTTSSRSRVRIASSADSRG